MPGRPRNPRLCRTYPLPPHWTRRKRQALPWLVVSLRAVGDDSSDSYSPSAIAGRSPQAGGTMTAGHGTPTSPRGIALFSPSERDEVGLAELRAFMATTVALLG